MKEKAVVTIEPHNALLLALANKDMEARLRTICLCLHGCGKDGKTKVEEYGVKVDCYYSDLITYGQDGHTFTQINELLSK